MTSTHQIHPLIAADRLLDGLENGRLLRLANDSTAMFFIRQQTRTLIPKRALEQICAIMISQWCVARYMYEIEAINKKEKPL